MPALLVGLAGDLDAVLVAQLVDARAEPHAADVGLAELRGRELVAGRVEEGTQDAALGAGHAAGLPTRSRTWRAVSLR